MTRRPETVSLAPVRGYNPATVAPRERRPETAHRQKEQMSDTEQTRPHDGDAAFIQALAELLNRNELTELTVKREYGENRNHDYG